MVSTLQTVTGFKMRVVTKFVSKETLPGIDAVINRLFNQDVVIAFPLKMHHPFILTDERLHLSLQVDNLAVYLFFESTISTIR